MGATNGKKQALESSDLSMEPIRKPVSRLQDFSPSIRKAECSILGVHSRAGSVVKLSIREELSLDLCWPGLFASFVALVSISVLLRLTLLYGSPQGCSLIENLPGPPPPFHFLLPHPLFFSRPRQGLEDWPYYSILPS